MRSMQVKNRFAAALLFVLASCGTNTEEPVFPLYTALTLIASPAIVSVRPVEAGTGFADYRIEFDLGYYVTNQEEGFLGYNLYISTSTTSAEAAVGGSSTGIYLPSGTAPSFPHVGSTVSTSSLQTQRLTHLKPPPGEKPFQLCEKYFFRMTALVRNGLESNASAEKSSCAAANAALCPKGSACNP